MKKFIVFAMLTSLMISGCKSEEPKQPPVKETTTQAIQAAADKAHKAIDKAETASQSLTERANKIKDAARKAATDMSATIQKSSAQVTEKTTEPQPAPAETLK